jgi:fluoroquinolone transport system ATP-binding protein
VIVSARGLRYRYPEAESDVLDGLDFEIGQGEVFGFLGPNGSGKSTTQKLLTRVLQGHGGEVQVFGRELSDQGSDYHERIGVCFEFPNLYEKLTAEENLGFYRRFFESETDEPAYWLERLDLPVGDRRPVGRYSKGMKMRVVLARSLLNRPALWFLDEPTSGQDPESAVRIRRLIRERADAGATVFLTTHNMTVADELCDRVAFLADGRIAAVGSPRELKVQHSEPVVRVEAWQGDRPITRDFSLQEPADKDSFLAFVRDQRIGTLHTQEPTLEDVFLKVTGKGLLA